MKPSARLVKVLAHAAITGPEDAARRPSAENPLAETITRWRVLPLDLDLFGHMNNSRYLLLMDYARVDYLSQLGLLRTAMKRRWVIPVGSAQLDFRRALKPFESFEIGTQVLSWDERWFYMRQTFRTVDAPDRPVATAHLKVIFRAPTAVVRPADVVWMAVQEDVVPPLLDALTSIKFGLPSPPSILVPPVAI